MFQRPEGLNGLNCRVFVFNRRGNSKDLCRWSFDFLRFRNKLNASRKASACKTKEISIPVILLFPAFTIAFGILYCCVLRTVLCREFAEILWPIEWTCRNREEMLRNSRRFASNESFSVSGKRTEDDMYTKPRRTCTQNRKRWPFSTVCCCLGNPSKFFNCRSQQYANPFTINHPG